MSEPLRKEVQIFNAALEMSSEAERADYLAQACAEDEVLRRKVEALLQAHAGQMSSFGPQKFVQVPEAPSKSPARLLRSRETRLVAIS